MKKNIFKEKKGKEIKLKKLRIKKCSK